MRLQHYVVSRANHMDSSTICTNYRQTRLATAFAGQQIVHIITKSVQLWK